jgi:hypothetical protein
MENLKKNTAEDALKALENTMKLLEESSSEKANTGACVWVTPSGQSFCAQLTPTDCSKINGAIFVGGACK